jgi:type IV secretion system protein VirD4
MIELIFSGMILAVCGLLWDKRALKERQKAAYKVELPKTYGSARWADRKDLRRAGVFRRRGLFFGWSEDGRRLFYTKAGHYAIFCAARGGKLLTVLISLIIGLGPNYSLYLLDPKLEMAPIIARIRRRCGKVFVWNPYHLWLDYLLGFPPCQLNPVADIVKRSKDKLADCVKLLSTWWSVSMVGTDAHFLPTALDLAATVLYALVVYGKPGEQNLPTLYKVISGGNGASIFEFMRYAVTLGDPVLNSGFSRYIGPDVEKNKEAFGVVSTTLTQMAWIKNEPAIAASLMNDDVSMFDLKEKAGTTIVSGLPLGRDVYGQASSLVSGWMLHCAQVQGSRGHKVPLVAVIDEMASLAEGSAKQWKDAFANGAGSMGLQIVAVYQDLSQVITQMGQNAWETVIQNCGLTLWFNLRDPVSRARVSELCGNREVVNKGHSLNFDQRTGEPHATVSTSLHSIPLIQAHEVGAMDAAGDMIALCEGLPPIKGKRKPYTRTEFGYGRNPYYRGR